MNKIELKKVETVDEKLLQEIVRRIVNTINPLRIILFGSWAYSKPHKGSDLDILVVVDDGVTSKYDVAVKVYGTLRGILIPKDVVITTPNMIKEWENVPQAFITTIVRKGRIVYERKN